MKVLVVGGGGREAALAWALSNSSHVTRVSCAPGNAGTPDNVAIGAESVETLVEHATAERYDLVVVGPEAPLVAGLADRLREAGIAVFGPSAAAARIEGSKIFAKELMARHGIPTARFAICDTVADAERYLESDQAAFPIVVKADGLAAGKGVIIAADRAEALAAVRAMLEERRFGEAGSRVLIEECLVGREVSFFALADGERIATLATCQDYKRALDGDRGLNTGGMGCYSPSAFIDEATQRRIVREVVEPTIAGMAAEGIPYRGVLFVGLMLTDDGPKVLEYNARFGDPETQVLVPRLASDWFELLHSVALGRLDPASLRWDERAAVCVVMAAGGYPGSYGKGHAISGLDSADAIDGCTVFHAGTARDGGKVVTTGGRVLGVTALADSLASARERAYEAVSKIEWNDVQYRRDIAEDAVACVTEGSR